MPKFPRWTRSTDEKFMNCLVEIYFENLFLQLNAFNPRK